MDLPVLVFIQSALSEGDKKLEVRKNTAFYDFFIKPQQLLLQPLFATLQQVLIAQSIRQVRLLADPDSFDQGAVDDLASNVFVDRFTGSYAETTARVYYASPVDLQFPALSAEFLTNTGFSYFNKNDIAITAAEMTLQTSGDLYYVDVPIIAQNPGSEYKVEEGGITTFISDANAISVTNLTSSSGGLPTETNIELLDRARNSIGVRDFETIKGINGIINEKFPGIFQEIQAIGYGDPEMMRDILYNAHVGGKSDIYLRTPALQTKSTSVIGLQFDFNREFSENVVRQLLAVDFTDPESELGTPFIVTNSVTVKDGITETSASILSAAVPPITGINLSANEYLRVQLDDGTITHIKVSGATPASTQRYEIINSINVALGQTVAVAVGANFIRITSQKVGAASKIRFLQPLSPRTDATLTLFPSLNVAPYNYSFTLDETVQGVAATVYIESVDYAVDYANGKIKKLPGTAILSGSTIVGPVSNGIITTGSDNFASPTPGEFNLVRVGDILNITSSTGVTVGAYIVRQVVDDQNLKIQSMVPTGNDSAVSYNIVSQQVLSISYKFNPLCVDIGPQVLLQDGITRGIRPGRDAYTIKDVAFLAILSVEEIDPDTEEGLGVFLEPMGGYGSGGYGEGGYGSGNGGDYAFIVNSPTERFSVFEDSTLLFDPGLFGKSYKFTYLCAPEVVDVHNVSRGDPERVTGADVLPKNFVPAFVDMVVPIRRDPTNISTPDNAGLAQLVSDYVNNRRIASSQAVDASQIEDLLLNVGVKSVQNPFTMTAEVVNTDGSSTILSSPDELVVPDVTLPKETANFVTKRITHFYARTISVAEVP